MTADGTLTLITQVNSAVKKLRVTPSLDTNLTRFAALAEERRNGVEEQAKTSAKFNW